MHIVWQVVEVMGTSSDTWSHVAVASPIIMHHSDREGRVMLWCSLILAVVLNHTTYKSAFTHLPSAVTLFCHCGCSTSCCLSSFTSGGLVTMASIHCVPQCLTSSFTPFGIMWACSLFTISLIATKGASDSRRVWRCTSPQWTFLWVNPTLGN